MVDEHGFMLPGAVPVIAEPGDVVLHSANLLHGSRVTRGKPLRRINYFAFFTIEEILSRGGPFDANLARSCISVMLQAVEARLQLPEAAGEEPYAYSPTLAEFKFDQGSLDYVERYIQRMPDPFDPDYRYSPHNPVRAVV